MNSSILFRSYFCDVDDAANLVPFLAGFSGSTKVVKSSPSIVIVIIVEIGVENNFNACEAFSLDDDLVVHSECPHHIVQTVASSYAGMLYVKTYPLPRIKLRSLHYLNILDQDFRFIALDLCSKVIVTLKNN